MKNSVSWSMVLVLAALTGGCGKGPDTNGPPPEATSTPPPEATSTPPPPPPEATFTPPQYPPGVDRKISIDLGGGVTMEFVLIPAGSFVMGDERGSDDERKVHRVTITKPFFLGKYEVTQEQWQAIQEDNPSESKGEKKPVEMVSWNECEGFLDKLNEKFREFNQERGKAGEAFRLPTEAEWEYACRAGSTKRYGFGNNPRSFVEGLHAYAWWKQNSCGETHPAGRKKPNAWGLYDMQGNVYEWCDDWYQPSYDRSVGNDPTGPDSGSEHVLRGKSWRSEVPDEFRCAYRNKGAPDFRSDGTGFRVAWAPPRPLHPLLSERRDK